MVETNIEEITDENENNPSTFEIQNAVEQIEEVQNQIDIGPRLLIDDDDSDPDPIIELIELEVLQNQVCIHFN